MFAGVLCFQQWLNELMNSFPFSQLIPFLVEPKRSVIDGQAEWRFIIFAGIRYSESYLFSNERIETEKIIFLPYVTLCHSAFCKL